MKALFRLCSVLLLGTVLFSGSSFAMEDATAEEGSKHRAYGAKQKLFFIESYTNEEEEVKFLSSLDCYALEVRLQGHIMCRIVGGAGEDDSSNDEDPFSFLKDLGKPKTYRHGTYLLPGAVAKVLPTLDRSKPSPHHVHIVNTITSTVDVEAIEKEHGPMVSAALSILSLCPHMENLTLNLLPVNLRAVQALQDTGRLSSLKKLVIRDGKMGDDEVGILLSSPLPVLEYLDFSHNALTGVSFSKASLPALKVLNLWNNKVDSNGFQAIAQSHSPLLHTLSLGGNKVDAEGMRAARWGERRIEILLLDCNPIGDEIGDILADPTYLPALKVLSLGLTKIGVKGLKLLALSSIKFIDARSCVFEDIRRALQKTSSNLYFGGLHSHHENGDVLTLAEIAERYHLKF